MSTDNIGFQSNDWFKKKMEQLRAARGNQCEECHTPLEFDERGQPNLQWAHIQPTGTSGQSRGRNRRIIDISKNPADYRLLCYNCHHRFDNRLKTVSDFTDHDLVELDGHRYIAFVSEAKDKVVLLPETQPEGSSLQPLELTDSQLPALNVQLIEHTSPMSIN